MVKIYVDDRERRTPVLEELKRLGAQIEIKRLEVADYATPVSYTHLTLPTILLV